MKNSLATHKVLHGIEVITNLKIDDNPRTRLEMKVLQFIEQELYEFIDSKLYWNLHMYKEVIGKLLQDCPE